MNECPQEGSERSLLSLRKCSQKCSRMAITETKPTNSPPALVKIYRPPLHSLWQAPPLPHPKGGMSCQTSKEKRGGLQQAGQLLFRRGLFLCFPISPWSIWNKYFFPLPPLRLRRTSVTSRTQFTASTWHRTRLYPSQHSDTWGMK